MNLRSALGAIATNGGLHAMSKVVGLGHIGLFVRDVDRMATFYRDFMGMQVTKRSPNGSATRFRQQPNEVWSPTSSCRRAPSSSVGLHRT